jgi:4'-phosphopantetheinyl transferase
MMQSWPEESEPPTLHAGDLHLWSVPLDKCPSPMSDMRQTLAPDERERADRYRRDDVRRRFVVARGSLRSLLSKYVHMPPDRILFDYNASGKPRLRHSPVTDFQFNLAHSGELAVIAITLGCEVGVDVEQLREVPHWHEIAERYFHPSELAALENLPAAAQLPSFLQCWTGKEAVLKAIGAGVTRPLDFYVGHVQPATAQWIAVTSAGPEASHAHLILPTAVRIASRLPNAACLLTRRTVRCRA